MSIRAWRGFTVGLVASLLAVAGLVTVSSAQAAPAAVTAGEPAVTPPPAIEDFTYPNAAQILAEKGIGLKRGDGHIVLTDCTSDYDIWIDTRVQNRGFCFDVTATTGFLELEVPDVFSIWTGPHAVEATLTTDGTEKTVVIPKNEMEEVGEGDSTTGNKPAVLVELRATS